MEYSIVVVFLALLQYQFFGLRTGISRPKYGVLPPKVTGNETWERMFRVHQNTMEQLVVFIPSMLIFSYYVSHMWAVILGVLFIIFRQIYSHLYIKNPPKRMFPPSFFVNMILVVGSLIGVIMQIVHSSAPNG